MPDAIRPLLSAVEAERELLPSLLLPFTCLQAVRHLKAQTSLLQTKQTQFFQSSLIGHVC